VVYLAKDTVILLSFFTSKLLLTGAMYPLHTQTMEFLESMLRAKQAQATQAVDTPEFTTVHAEFDGLSNRLYLEIEYGVRLEHGGWN